MGVPITWGPLAAVLLIGVIVFNQPTHAQSGDGRLIVRAKTWQHRTETWSGTDRDCFGKRSPLPPYDVRVRE